MKVDNLISEHCHNIENNGYTIIPEAFTEKLADKLKDKIESLERSLGSITQSGTPYLNQGHRIVYSLENKDRLFTQVMLNDPLTKGIMLRLLNDKWYKQSPQNAPNFILRAMIARTGGKESLPLHIDSFMPSSGKFCWALQISYTLDEQTIENGCTVVVPKSHKSDAYAQQEDLKKAIPIQPKKGDIVIWDSRLWHGANPNKTSKTRWVFIGTFTRWWIKQNYQTTANIPKAIVEDLNDEEKSILGFCSAPPFDENERVDIKGGYELFEDIMK